MNGINDIVERSTNDEPQEPKAPKISNKPRPAPRKWGNPRRRPLVLDPDAPRGPQLITPTKLQESAPLNTNSELSEDERIHLENIRKLQAMTPDQIAQEREEIFKTMNPDILQSLLRRAELKEKEQFESGNSSAKPNAKGGTNGNTSNTPKLVPPKTQNQGQPIMGASAPSKGTITDWDPEPSTGINENVYFEREFPVDDPRVEITGDPSTVHFPSAPDQMREYFPDLPMETDKLAWMQPVSEAEENEYSSQLVSVAPSELRFDFQGNLITPNISRKIPTTYGLHHHGDAPSAAGYTIPELAHLCRSSYNAQRSMAIQTVGRILHKLRRKVYAKSSDLQEGLEQLVKQTRVMETLIECADENTRSLTVRSLATEALWLANSDSD